MSLGIEPSNLRFNAVRVPTSPADVPLAYPAHENHHIVVVRNDRYFKVDTRGRGKKELAEAFRQVKQLADGQKGSGVGVLTADDRDVWSEVSTSFSELTSGSSAHHVVVS